MVPVFTWRHHVSCPLLWHLVSRLIFRCFRCLWKFFFYMCFRLINRSFIFCYCYFSAKFPLSTELIMASARERLFLVGVLYIKSATTYWWASEGLPGVLKKNFLAYIVIHCSVHLDALWEFLMIVLLLRVHCLECKEVGGGIFELKYFLVSADLYKLIDSTSHSPIQWTSLNSNHAFFHRVDMLHHSIHSIFHSMRCRFVRYFNVVRVT